MVAMMKEMKDSGIEWIGQIPEEWSLVPIRAVFEEVTDKNFDGSVKNALKFTYGAIVPKTNFEADNDDYVANTILNYTVVEPGTIVLNGLNLNFDFVSQRIGLVKNKGVITTAYMAFKPLGERVSPEYATYLFKAYDGCKALHNMGGGVRKILNFSEFKRYYVCFPTLLEQQAIVTYLDAKCAEIDTLSADIQSEIDTLEAYKRSKVFAAVSHGVKNTVLDETDSYVWASIPHGWKLIDIKYLFEIVKRIAGKEGYDILAITKQGIKVKDIASNEGQIASDYSGYQFVYPGDFAMNCLDLNAGWIDISPLFGVTSPDYRVFRLRDRTHFCAEYYKYLFQMCYSEKIFYSLTQGVTESYRRLPTSVFNNFKVPVPPKDEQVQIAAFLDKICGEVDTIIAQKREQLAVLADYKKSVIYEYVTGKKEVPAI